METPFSSNISKLRKERGLNQRKAASELKISQALLSHYENGIREPGLDFLVRVCDYYGVSADYVLGRTNIRETVLSKSMAGTDGENAPALDRMKQEAIILAATIFRIVSNCGDTVAEAALNYIASSGYRLLCGIFGPDSGLLSPNIKRAEALSEIDMRLLCLEISEELARKNIKITPELVHNSISKSSYKSFESMISRTEERLGTSKADKK